MQSGIGLTKLDKHFCKKKQIGYITEKGSFLHREMGQVVLKSAGIITT